MTSLRGDMIKQRGRLNERFDEKGDALPRYRALLGDGAGNLYPDTDELTIVYARRVGRGRIDRVRNTRIVSRNDLPVIVGYTHERPHELQVLEEDTAVMESMGAYGYVRRHGQQHSLFDPSGGDDTVWVWGQQFLPFLVQETDPISLYVDVRIGHYIYNNSYRTFGGGTTPDLSTYAPAAGLAIMLHIVVDASSGFLDFIVGSEFSSALPEHMREDMIPLAPEGTLACGAIYIPNGITEVTWDEIHDTRPFVQAVQSGGSHQMLSTSHIDTSPDDLTRGDILVAIADDVLARLAAGGAYQLLQMDATGDDPEWNSFDWDEINQAAGADMVHDHTSNAEGGVLGGAALPHTILDNSAHTDTVAHVVVAGDILYGDATPDWNALAHPGAANRVLQSTAALVGWSAQTLVIEAASIVNQDLTTDASVTFADVYVPDSGTFGIVGNELLTVNAAGTFAFSGIAGITVEDADYIGNSAATARLGFNSGGATDYAYFLGCNVGIGTATPGNAHLSVYDAALTSTATFYGIRVLHAKTGGAGAAGDDYYGIWTRMQLNQATTVDNIYAGWFEGILTTGTSDSLVGIYGLSQTQGGTAADVRGMQGTADVNAGTVTGSVFGLLGIVDIEAAVTSIGGDVHGIHIDVDADTAPVGTVRMLYMVERSNVDYGVYQNGTADNYFGGNITAADVYVPDGGTFGIVGNELLTVNAAGTFAFSGIAGITVEDADYIGNSAATARLHYDSSGAINYAYFMDCNVGIGAAAPGNIHLSVYDGTLTSTATFIGLRSFHVKTAGAGAAGDDYYGMYSWIELNQATTIDEMYGSYCFSVLRQGTAGVMRGAYFATRMIAGTATGVRGFQAFIDLNAGTVGSAYGMFVDVDVEAAMTAVNGSIYGLYIRVDDDQGAVGSVRMLHLEELTGVDYGVYQNGTADNYFGGEVGIGALPTGGQLHVDNVGTTAQPVLYLDQGDVSEEMIQFETTIGVGNAIEAVGGKSLTTTHFIKITIPGALTRYIPCGTIA